MMSAGVAAGGDPDEQFAAMMGRLQADADAALVNIIRFEKQQRRRRRLRFPRIRFRWGRR